MDYKLLLEAVQYGFKYALESQNDGEAVPQGNIDQWLMWKMGFTTKEQLDHFKTSQILPDIAKYPYHGICGKCSNYAEKLDRSCLCQSCYSFGVRRNGLPLSNEIFKFVKTRF